MPKEVIKIEDGVNLVFNVFYESINPTINYANKSYRNSANELILKFGLEKTISAARYAVSIQGKKYAPLITTPHELKEKMAKLVIFYKRQEDNKPKIANI